MGGEKVEVGFETLKETRDMLIKDAEATCVEIATEMKKCSISLFSEIFSPYKHVLAAFFRK